VSHLHAQHISLLESTQNSDFQELRTKKIHLWLIRTFIKFHVRPFSSHIKCYTSLAFLNELHSFSFTPRVTEVVYSIQVPILFPRILTKRERVG